MAIAFAQNLGDLNTASGTSLSGTFGSSTVSGNLILAAARVGVQGRTQTFSDNKSNTWASNPIELDHGVGNHLVVGYALNITGGASHQITLSISGAAASIRMVIWEESGIATASALDKTSTGTSAVEATVDSGATAATTQADEWLFCAGSWDGSGTPTADAAYGHLIGAPSGTSKKMAAEDRIVSATGTYNGTFTVTAGFGQWGCAIVTFKAAASGHTLAVGIATETDSALALGKVKAKALTLATETDSALSLGRLKSRLLGVGLETDTAPSVAWAPKRRLVGIATETDTALAIAASTSGGGLVARLRTLMKLGV